MSKLKNSALFLRIARLFSKAAVDNAPVAIAQREPKPGELWWHGSGGDPFPPPESSTKWVKILDSKDGWVRYYMNYTFPDERMRIALFLKMYRTSE